MQVKTYEKDALRTANLDKDNMSLLQEGLMGLSGEAGEAIDILKKHLWQGHDLDKQHLALELGDVQWYLTLAAHALGYSLNDILRMNIHKRNQRYPEKFDSELSINRDENDI
jgi:NTP pyrophosphatase (non-canonical NTP hydrolase)